MRNWFHTKAGARFLNGQTRWFNLRAPHGYAVLTTLGRRSHKQRRACVRAVVRGSRAILVATGGRTCDWFRNIEAHPHVCIRIGKTTFEAIARPAGDEEVSVLAHEFCRDVFLFDRFASVVNQRGMPTTRRIRAMHERWCTEGMIAVVDTASTR